MNKYEEIINLSYTPSKKHPRMSIINRAAQFAPYAALVGYDSLVKEAGRIVDKRIELNEDEYFILNNNLQYLNEHKDVLANFTYFVKDKKKDGGSYKEQLAYLNKIDVDRSLIILDDGTKIALDNLVKISY